MNAATLGIVALLLGIVLGVSVIALLWVLLRMRDRQREANTMLLSRDAATVLAGLDDAAIVIDGSSVVRAASPAADRVGMSIGEVIDNEEIRALAARVRTTGSSQQEEIRIRRSRVSSEEIPVRVRMRHLGYRLVFVLIKDLSEQQRVDQMRQDFIAGTSHELKTPIGAVSLLAEALEMAADDPERVRDYAARISAEARRLGDLTTRIMELSRLQSEEDFAHVDDVTIDEVLSVAIEAHRITAESAGVSLVRGGDRGLFVRGDKQVLTEAVGNLIANAIAYSPAGSRVGVGTKKEKGAVLIVVSDQGIGISPEDQERVFERFYRADRARSRQTGGTGLGLSIVKHGVQRHGGEVRLWSQPGKGSTFTIALPRADKDPASSKKKKKKKEAKR